MHLSQMFPKKTLDAADLAAMSQGYTVVTIEKLDFKTHEARDPGDAEISYYLHFREFKKPMRLNATNCHNIAEVLGSDSVDDWIGKTISIRPHYHKLTDKLTKRTMMIWIFDVDIARPTMAPTLMPKQDITGLAGMIKGGPKPGLTAPPQQGALPGTASAGDIAAIGIEKAAAMIAALRERGKTADDVFKHMGTVGMSHLVSGKIPPDWPAAVIPPVHAFCKMFPKIAPPPTTSELEGIKTMWRPPPASATDMVARGGDVIDKGTGELIASGVPPVRDYTFEPFQEEDIPF